MIFGIGLNKTGTTSLTEALNILGIPCLHDTLRVKTAVTTERENGMPLLSTLADDYEAFTDYPISEIWPELDHLYQGSLFIWTDRELEPWIESRVRHVEFNLRMNELGRGNAWTHDWVTIDVERWTQEYHDHRQSVEKYFAGREDDLLRMQICDGYNDGWRELCEFLGVDQPSRAFPKFNVGAKNYMI